MSDISCRERRKTGPTQDRRKAGELWGSLYFYARETGGSLTKLLNQEIFEIPYEDAAAFADQFIAEISCGVQTHIRKLANRFCLPKKISSGFVEEIQRAAEKLYMEPDARAQVADAVGYSVNYMSSRFHQETGERFHVYLQRLRMTKARHLLRYSDLAVARIGEAVGYPNSRYFARAYKAQYGRCPSEEERFRTEIPVSRKTSSHSGGF